MQQERRLAVLARHLGPENDGNNYAGSVSAAGTQCPPVVVGGIVLDLQVRHLHCMVVFLW
jgi:hypothetical protein